VLSGVEVYLDATEHAADGKRSPGAVKIAVTTMDTIPPAQAGSTLERLGSTS
jgi:hypothetical protein